MTEKTQSVYAYSTIQNATHSDGTGSTKNTEKLCDVQGCKKNRYRREWCSMHYTRWVKTGDLRGLEPETTRGQDLEARLLTRRRVDPQTNCWEWTGTCRKAINGKLPYGNFTVPFNGGRRCTSPHRTAAHLWHGLAFDDPREVCHKCDNPKCFNPDHLFVGTHSDNMKDAVRKGRMPTTEKVTNDQVLEIRRRRSTGEPLKSIAEDYPVTWHHVWMLCKTDRRKVNEQPSRSDDQCRKCGVYCVHRSGLCQSCR